MANITLPADKFDKNLTFTRPATVPARVPLDKLAVLPGFNTRVKDADYGERVAGITQSIVANGYFDDKPLAVTMLPNDETIYVYDGEHRFDAAKAAVLDGAEFPEGLPVSFAKDGTTVRDLTIHLARGNEGAQLNMVESAAVVRRLLDLGLTKEEIATELNRSGRHIENLITLAGANTAVKKAVAEGKLAGAEAVKIVRKHGNKDGAAKVAEVVKAAEEKGKTKATPKTMAVGPKMKRVEETISLGAGTALADVLKALSTILSGNVKLNDDENLTEDGKLVVTLHVIDHEGIAAAEQASKERAEAAAKREQERAEAKAKREAEKAAREAAKAAEPKPEAKTPAKGKTAETKPKAARTARPKKDAATDPNNGL